MFPGAQRMNRGNHEIKTLVHACKANNVTDLVIIHETRGQPGITMFYYLISICFYKCVCTVYKDPGSVLYFVVNGTVLNYGYHREILLFMFCFCTFFFF